MKSEQSEQGEMMRAHTNCQKPYERRVSEYLRSTNTTSTKQMNMSKREMRYLETPKKTVQCELFKILHKVRMAHILKQL